MPLQPGISPNKAFWEALTLVGALLAALFVSVLHYKGWLPGGGDATETPSKKSKKKRSSKKDDTTQDRESEDTPSELPRRVESNAATREPASPPSATESPASSPEAPPKDRSPAPLPERGRKDDSSDDDSDDDGQGGPPDVKAGQTSIDLDYGPGRPGISIPPSPGRDFHIDYRDAATGLPVTPGRNAFPDREAIPATRREGRSDWPVNGMQPLSAAPAFTNFRDVDPWTSKTSPVPNQVGLDGKPVLDGILPFPDGKNTEPISVNRVHIDVNPVFPPGMLTQTGDIAPQDPFNNMPLSGSSQESPSESSQKNESPTQNPEQPAPAESASASTTDIEINLEMQKPPAHDRAADEPGDADADTQPMEHDGGQPKDQAVEGSHATVTVNINPPEEEATTSQKLEAKEAERLRPSSEKSKAPITVRSNRESAPTASPKGSPADRERSTSAEDEKDETLRNHGQGKTPETDQYSPNRLRRAVRNAASDRDAHSRSQRERSIDHAEDEALSPRSHKSSRRKSEKNRPASRSLETSPDRTKDSKSLRDLGRKVETVNASLGERLDAIDASLGGRPSPTSRPATKFGGRTERSPVIEARSLPREGVGRPALEEELRQSFAFAPPTDVPPNRPLRPQRTARHVDGTHNLYTDAPVTQSDQGWMRHDIYPRQSKGGRGQEPMTMLSVAPPTGEVQREPQSRLVPLEKPPGPTLLEEETAELALRTTGPDKVETTHRDRAAVDLRKEERLSKAPSAVVKDTEGEPSSSKAKESAATPNDQIGGASATHVVERSTRDNNSKPSLEFEEVELTPKAIAHDLPSPTAHEDIHEEEVNGGEAGQHSSGPSFDDFERDFYATRGIQTGHGPVDSQIVQQSVNDEMEHEPSSTTADQKADTSSLPAGQPTGTMQHLDHARRDEQSSLGSETPSHTADSESSKDITPPARPGFTDREMFGDEHGPGDVFGHDIYGSSDTAAKRESGKVDQRPDPLTPAQLVDLSQMRQDSGVSSERPPAPRSSDRLRDRIGFTDTQVFGGRAPASDLFENSTDIVDQTRSHVSSWQQTSAAVENDGRWIEQWSKDTGAPVARGQDVSEPLASHDVNDNPAALPRYTLAHSEDGISPDDRNSRDSGGGEQVVLGSADELLHSPVFYNHAPAPAQDMVAPAIPLATDQQAKDFDRDSAYFSDEDRASVNHAMDPDLHNEAADMFDEDEVPYILNPQHLSREQAVSHSANNSDSRSGDQAPPEFTSPGNTARRMGNNPARRLDATGPSLVQNGDSKSHSGGYAQPEAERRSFGDNTNDANASQDHITQGKSAGESRADLDSRTSTNEAPQEQLDPSEGKPANHFGPNDHANGLGTATTPTFSQTPSTTQQAHLHDIRGAMPDQSGTTTTPHPLDRKGGQLPGLDEDGNPTQEGRGRRYQQVDHPSEAFQDEGVAATVGGEHLQPEEKNALDKVHPKLTARQQRRVDRAAKREARKAEPSEQVMSDTVGSKSDSRRGPVTNEQPVSGMKPDGLSSKLAATSQDPQTLPSKAVTSMGKRSIIMRSWQAASTSPIWTALLFALVFVWIEGTRQLAGINQGLASSIPAKRAFVADLDFTSSIAQSFMNRYNIEPLGIFFLINLLQVISISLILLVLGLILGQSSKFQPCAGRPWTQGPFRWRSLSFGPVLMGARLRGPFGIWKQAGWRTCIRALLFLAQVGLAAVLWASSIQSIREFSKTGQAQSASILTDAVHSIDSVILLAAVALAFAMSIASLLWGWHALLNPRHLSGASTAVRMTRTRRAVLEVIAAIACMGLFVALMKSFSSVTTILNLGTSGDAVLGIASIIMVLVLPIVGWCMLVFWGIAEPIQSAIARAVGGSRKRRNPTREMV